MLTGIIHRLGIRSWSNDTKSNRHEEGYYAEPFPHKPLGWYWPLMATSKQIQRVFQARDGEDWVLKTHGHLGRIEKQLSQREWKLVVIERDQMEVARSLAHKSQTTTGSASVQKRMGRMKVMMRRAIKRAAKQDAPMYTVRYGGIIERPEDEIRALQKFLGRSGDISEAVNFVNKSLKHW
jgi:hypothetical protein